jgi:hypothetical protein
MAPKPQDPGFVETVHASAQAEIVGKPVQVMDDSERHKSFVEGLAQNPIVETPDQKAIRDLATKANAGQLSNVDLQTAIKLLLNARAKDISRTRKPLP